MIHTEFKKSFSLLALFLSVEDKRRSSEVQSDSHVLAVHWEFITAMRTA